MAVIQLVVISTLFQSCVLKANPIPEGFGRVNVFTNFPGATVVIQSVGTGVRFPVQREHLFR